MKLLPSTLNYIVVFNGFGLFRGSEAHVTDFVAECQLDTGIVNPLGIHLVEWQRMQIGMEGHPVGQEVVSGQPKASLFIGKLFTRPQ